MTPDSWNDSHLDEPSDELDDREGPQPLDLAGSGDSDEHDVVPCPHCGREISELAERCPHCGDWIVLGSGSRRKSALIAIAILLLLLLVLWVLY